MYVCMYMQVLPCCLSLLYFMFQVYCLAGGVAGVAEALVLNPFEVVKVAQQANKGIYTQVCELGASNSFFVGSTLPDDSP